MKRQRYKPGSDVLFWWRELTGNTNGNAGETNKGDRAAVARLKRVSEPVMALSQPSVARLAKRLTDNDPAVTSERKREEKLQRIGVIAAVLAYVKTNKDKQTARLLGPANNEDDSAAMSSLRFHRLLAARGPDELMREMRNAVKLLDGAANVADLADSLYHWDDDRTRIRWTYAYWNAADATPEQTEQKIAEQ